jgi:hypothetical protein
LQRWDDAATTDPDEGGGGHAFPGGGAKQFKIRLPFALSELPKQSPFKKSKGLSGSLQTSSVSRMSQRTCLGFDNTRNARKFEYLGKFEDKIENTLGGPPLLEYYWQMIELVLLHNLDLYKFS